MNADRIAIPGGVPEGAKLIIVSNREPYVHKRSGLRVSLEQPAGGLTAALDDVLRTAKGTWIAWGNGNADRDTVDDRGHVMVPPADPAYTLRRVLLKPKEVDNYYHGYANQVLWPLCHITLDRVFYRRIFWDYYERVNRIFSQAVLEEAGEQDIIWIHDYHLCLLPRMLRNHSPQMTLAHFWHTPWPDWSVFRVCPQAREVLKGLLANDLLAFQVPLFVRNFLACVRECLDADIDDARQAVTYRGRTTSLKGFAISVDYAKFNAMAAVPRTARMMAALRERHHLQDVAVGIGVDRLEYTKALIKRLQAVEIFFERYASFRRRFTFIQIAVPTRMREPYLSYGRIVLKMNERINRRYGQGAWKPIVYITHKVDHEDLAAYYRMADLAVISSVYDGMNLVAKEFASSQIDEQGVLILSEFAGAAEELEGALLVNPYDLEAFSEQIKTALIMPREERRARMASLRSQIRDNTIHDWVGKCLAAAVSCRDRRSAQPCFIFDNLRGEVESRIKGREIALFLDFDGTLAPIVDQPERASLSGTVRRTVMNLAGLVPVAVVSGRSMQDLRSRVGIENVLYAANHGAEIWDGERLLRSGDLEGAEKTMPELLSALHAALDPVPGVLIEDKGITASVHVRRVEPDREGEVLTVFWDLAKAYEGTFRITAGEKVLEVRPLNAWNKGQAVERILELRGKDTMPLYIGDDVTDQDAFKAIKGIGISVSIGPDPVADYCLRDQDEVAPLLEWLHGCLQRTGTAGK